MALSFPSWAEPIEWLVGADWPHGNEDLMREMGRDLDDVAKDIRALIPELDGIISGLKEVYPEGSGGEKIVAWMQPLRDSADGNHGSLEKFAANYELLSQSADSMGDQLEAAKLNFYISFGWVLAELALAAMSGPVGWFSSSAIFATARAAFRVIANTLFGRIAAIIARIAGGRISEAMVKRVLMEGLQEALVETLQGTSQELLVQTIQKQSGNIDGYNWDAVWKNAAVSAVAGGAGGLTGGLASLRFDTRMGGRQGALNGAVVGGLGGLGGALAAGLVTGEFDPRSLTGGIFSGAGPGAIRGLRGNGTVAVNIDRMPTAPTLDGAVPTVEPVTAADPAAALAQPAQAGDPNSPANSPQSTQPAGSSGDPGKGATESPEAGDPAAARATESEPTDSAPPAADSRRDSDARETSDESGAPRDTTGTTQANSPDSGASHQSTGDTGPADRGSQDRSNAGDPAADTRSAASPDPATSEARAAADSTNSGTDSTATSADRPADTTPASASPNGQAPSAGAPNGLTGASPAAPTAAAPGTSGPGTAGAQSAASAQPAGTSPAAPNTSSPAAPPPSGSTATPGSSTPGSSTPGSSTPGSSTQNPAPSQQPAHPHESGRTSRPDGAASLDATTDGSRPPVVASPSRAGLVDAAQTSPFTAAPQAISTGVAVDPATSTSSAPSATSATDTDSTPAAALVAPVALFVAATDTPRTAPRMPWDGRDSGQRGTASPVGEFHGDARPAGQPDLDTAQLLTAISDNLLLITPETVSWNRDGGHFVLPDGRRIHLTIAATANGAVAQFGPATDGDGYEVRVSPRARTSDVPRALAHELAEIALSLDPDIDIDPVTETPTTMTTHLGGRFAELRVLLSQVDRATFDPARAAELPALRRDLADLSAHLDLDDPAGSRNRDLLRDHDPRLAQRFGLEQNNPFAARPTIGPDTDLAEDTAPYDARLEGHLDGEYADSLRRMENAGLQGRIREELARRVFDPLFTGPEAKAARRTVPTPDLLSALDPINAALNDTTTTEAQRARAVSAAIDGFRDAMPQAFRDTFGDSGFQRMYDAAADLANHPRRITAELDQNAGTVTVDGRPLSFVDFLRDVDHANRGATALGVDVEYTVVVHDPVDGRSAVEILPRPRPQHRLPLPQNVFGEDDHRIEHQPRPAASATAAGAHTIDVGVGRSAFGVEMTPAADRAAGGLIIKTELASEFPVAAQRRRDRGILDPGPLTAPGTVMVFGDLLSNGGALVHGGTGTVGRIFINNVSAHFDPSQYDALAAQLVRSLAPGGRIELQWDTKPESETGYVNDRGHIDGDRLFAALQRLYPDTDLPFRVQERTEFPPPGNSDYDYTIDAGGSNVLNRQKMAEFSAPRPDHRMVIVYEPAGAGGPSEHRGAAAAVGDFHGHARPDDRPDLTDPTTEVDSTPTVDTDTPIDLEAIHNQHAEHTPAGISHHRGDPTMGDLPHRVPPDPNHYTADTHITPDGHAQIGNHTLTPQQYADLLRRSGWDGVTPIRLIGCDASTNGFAQQLARELGVDVLAPTHAAWTDTNGNIYSSTPITNPDGTRSPRIPPDGQWQTHHPNGTTTLAGPDANPPGTAAPMAIDTSSAVDRSQPAQSPNAAQSPSTTGTPTPASNTTSTPPGYQTPFGDRRDAVRDRITPPQRVVDAPPLAPNQTGVHGVLRNDYPIPIPAGDPTKIINGKTASGEPFTDHIFGDPPKETVVRNYPPRAVDYPRSARHGGGTFTVMRHEQHIIYPPDDKGNVRSISRSQVGDNVVSTESLNGRHVRTEGVIRHDFARSDRVDRDDDSRESTAATNTGHEGVDPTGTGLTYDGGHASSYRTTLDRGLVNLFAQERVFNQVQFRVLENAIADWARSGAGRETQIKIETTPAGAVTPDRVRGRIRMVDGKGKIYRSIPINFSNQGGNVFDRKGHGIRLIDYKKHVDGR
ncbi:WXG100-like domain-containing protein [Nocardia shimofusensis]|uniref:WXG100-like domain-containing protein n=1 Tax=Nocardia shimofusensis TaxID=228596 RepID=UPI00082A2D88|nr:hypothetical protein [Nocardia shimofusensis]